MVKKTNNDPKQKWIQEMRRVVGAAGWAPSWHAGEQASCEPNVRRVVKTINCFSAPIYICMERMANSGMYRNWCVPADVA